MLAAKTSVFFESVLYFQANGTLSLHAGRSGSNDEVVRAQRRVRAARDGPRDLPAVLVEEPAVHQHSVPCRADGKTLSVIKLYRFAEGAWQLMVERSNITPICHGMPSFPLYVLQPTTSLILPLHSHIISTDFLFFVSSACCGVGTSQMTLNSMPSAQFSSSFPPGKYNKILLFISLMKCGVLFQRSLHEGIFCYL